MGKLALSLAKGDADEMGFKGGDEDVLHQPETEDTVTWNTVIEKIQCWDIDDDVVAYLRQPRRPLPSSVGVKPTLTRYVQEFNKAEMHDLPGDLHRLEAQDFISRDYGRSSDDAFSGRKCCLELHESPGIFKFED